MYPESPFCLAADSAKLVSPRSWTDEKVGGPVKNMGGPIKLLYITMFKIGKSCKKLIFGPVKHEKFSQCLLLDLTGRMCLSASVFTQRLQDQQCGKTEGNSQHTSRSIESFHICLLLFEQKLSAENLWSGRINHGCLTKPLLKLGHVWAITSHMK